MTTGRIVSPPHRDTFAVIPVVDYEPPTRNIPQCAPSSHAAVRRHISTTISGTISGTRRRPEPAGPRQLPAVPVLSVPMRQAAAFADAALRRVLEVIDRRRPAAALRPLLTPALVDSVLTVGRSAAAPGGAAVLRRVRLQPVGTRDAAAEVFGSYSRGDRMHALAGRVELMPDTGSRWQLVALHIG